MDRNDRHVQLTQTGSSTTTQSCAMDHGPKPINHGKVIGNIKVGDFHKTHGTRVPQQAVATLAQKDHSPETKGHN